MDTMMESKYVKKGSKKRNCEECKNFGGMLSKHYFLCTAEVYVEQERIASRNVYDIKVLKKGSCLSFKPKEVSSVLLSDYITMECDFEEDITDLHYKE